MKIKFNFIILVVQSIVLLSCASKKDIIYFRKGQINSDLNSNDYQIKFKPDDLIAIKVLADDPSASKPFNLLMPNFNLDPTLLAGQPALETYLIDKNGEIDFPILGTIKLEGMTRIEAINFFKNELSPKYLSKAIVNINLLNFNITVQGDVKLPGTYNVKTERISILDALGRAGDLNISARRDNVLVVREENGKKIQYRLNLLSNEIFNSPAYYLKQNDLVYVEPNSAKAMDSKYTRTTGLFISFASLLVTVITLLTR